MNSRCLFKTTTLGQRRWPPRRATVRRAAALRHRHGTAALAVSALFGIWQIGLFGGKGKFVSSVSLAGKNMPVRTLEFIGKVQLEITTTISKFITKYNTYIQSTYPYEIVTFILAVPMSGANFVTIEHTT